MWHASLVGKTQNIKIRRKERIRKGLQGAFMKGRADGSRQPKGKGIKGGYVVHELHPGIDSR